MPRMTASSEFDNRIFADTQVIRCRDRSTGKNAQALRFSSTLGNFHAIDQWAQDGSIGWDPVAETLKLGGASYAKGDYLVSVDNLISRLSEDEFGGRFDVRENANSYGAPYATP
ncbi:hypothetical protein ASG63_22960 [Methylobacterium sp. Leaf94]|uniref:hypothetical protein n=1 Tax=Methylobacterium sp. Leaf94 TaxID=1736250 RepID=UPI000701E2A1|nr:hypothetical protein [Methylobacterium sp. Leaf94]KQU21658.1 hypothetical protein ASG63_22960 [Methylobacterium sp. Leaf94]